MAVSVFDLFKIGIGPSSSHTVGPMRAAHAFVQRLQRQGMLAKVARLRCQLFGSLGATGIGHASDRAVMLGLAGHAPDTVDVNAVDALIAEVHHTQQLLLNGEQRIVFDPATDLLLIGAVSLPFHPNGMRFEAFKAGKPVDEWVIYSVGGGALANEETAKNPPANIYPMTHISEILEWCNREGQTFWEYVEECEGPGIWDYLDEIWTAMCETIVRGLTAEGVLPGGLKVSRKASTYLVKAESYTDTLRSRAKLYAYALATAEENASGGTVVTAPTCGSSAVMPAVLYHLVNTRNFSRLRILRALATGGLFGNVAKTNSSISGAEVGCQGEVGVACAMAAAAACQLFGGTPSQIEYAAEMGLEHHLGLTCDPVCGLVQIPCIERNAVAAARALDANSYANLSDGHHMISYDRVVEVMKETGKDIPSLYRETSEGGLARNYTQK